MNKLYIATIIILALNSLVIANKAPDVSEFELQILRNENLVLQNEIEMVYGRGYIPGTLCDNIVYKESRGTVVRIGECK